MEDVINYLKDLDIAIKKKMFLVSKKANISNPPTPLQVRIFTYLYDHGEEDISPTDLVRSLNVSKVAISEALTKMESNGHIVIKESVEDKRKKVLTYTKQALNYMEEMMNTFDVLNKELTKDVNPEKLDIFIEVIKKMKENLEEE